MEEGRGDREFTGPDVLLMVHEIDLAQIAYKIKFILESSVIHFSSL
jgi:hypothetical protein